MKEFVLDSAKIAIHLTLIPILAAVVMTIIAPQASVGAMIAMLGIYHLSLSCHITHKIKRGSCPGMDIQYLLNIPLLAGATVVVCAIGTPYIAYLTILPPLVYIVSSYALKTVAWIMFKCRLIPEVLDLFESCERQITKTD